MLTTTKDSHHYTISLVAVGTDRFIFLKVEVKMPGNVAVVSLSVRLRPQIIRPRHGILPCTTGSILQLQVLPFLISKKSLEYLSKKYNTMLYKVL